LCIFADAGRFWHRLLVFQATRRAAEKTFRILTLRPESNHPGGKAGRMRVKKRKAARAMEGKSQNGRRTKKMTSEEMLSLVAVNSWKQVVGRFDQGLAALSDEQLQKQIAPGRNRLYYLLGHLTAVNDRMFPLLGIGDRLHAELDEPFITQPDQAGTVPVPASELRKAWTEVNGRLTSAFEAFTPAEWVQKHAAVSDEDFVTDPTRNRLAVVMSRTNHVSLHSGQAVLAR
jgi:DinB superfamily